MHVSALVITRRPLHEHDQVVTLYCRELGKVLAVAKSGLKAHSTQALHLDEGNLIECELVAGKGMPIITGAQSLSCLSSAKTSAVRWAAVQFFLQVIDAVVYDQQEDDALFVCVGGILNRFNEIADDQALAVFRQSQDELLYTMGYGRASAQAVASDWRGRTELDDAYERIAQRHMGTLDLFYEVASTRFL